MIKKMLIIVILFVGFNAISQEQGLKIKIMFYKNSKPIDGLKCYIIGKEDKAYLLPSKNDTIILKDTVNYWINEEHKTNKTIEVIELFYDR